MAFKNKRCMWYNIYVFHTKCMNMKSQMITAIILILSSVKIKYNYFEKNKT